VRLVENCISADWSIRVPLSDGKPRVERRAVVVGPPEREVILVAEILVDPSQVCVIECRRSDIRNEIVRLSRRWSFGAGQNRSKAFEIGSVTVARSAWSALASSLPGRHLAEAFPRSKEKCLILPNRPQTSRHTDCDEAAPLSAGLFVKKSAASNASLAEIRMPNRGIIRAAFRYDADLAAVPRPNSAVGTLVCTANSCTVR